VTQDARVAFFSYHGEDSGFALRLASDLKAAGASVWMDRLDISPAQRWDRAVEDALTKCQRMVVILSPAAVNSTNVMDEVSFALEEQKTLIPVIYRDCTVPIRLRRLQYVDFRKDYDRGVKELVKTLAPKQEAESSTPVPVVDSPSPFPLDVRSRVPERLAILAPKQEAESSEPVPAVDPPSSFSPDVRPRVPGSSDIFISYAKADKPRARQLAEALELVGWTVWWDRRIPIGKSFSQVIQAELQGAKCALVLWSQTSVTSDWVEAEAAKAKQMGKLVPVLIDDVGTLIPLEFSRLQAANLCNWCGGDGDPEFKELHTAITQYVPLSNPTQHGTDPKTSKHRR
jgi:hypothetical protein